MFYKIIKIIVVILGILICPAMKWAGYPSWMAYVSSASMLAAIILFWTIELTLKRMLRKQNLEKDSE